MFTGQKNPRALFVRRAALAVLMLVVLSGCVHGPGTSTKLAPRGTSSRSAEELRIMQLSHLQLKNINYGLIALELSDAGGQTVSLYLDRDDGNRLKAVGSGKIFEIHYWYSETRSSFRSTYPHAELASVRYGGDVVIDRTRCRKHVETMIRQPVRIAYGLPMRAFAEAHEREFPNAPFQFGGCVIMDDSPKKAPAYVCAACEIAYKAWTPPANDGPSAVEQ